MIETARIFEQLQAGAGRRELPLPVRASYTLGELLPRRPRDPGYTLPGEMGPELSRAFERAFSLLERGHGTLAVHAPAKLLTPRWHRVMNRLVHHGLAKTLLLSAPRETGIPLYYFDISAPFIAHKTDGIRPDLPRYSRGFSQDYDHALSKVVGECLERTTLLYFRMGDLLRGSARSLRARRLSFVHPQELSVFARWQMERRPELRFDDDSAFAWTEATSLMTGRKAWLPAQLVYWNYPTDWGDTPEPLLREQSSHGAGGYFSTEGAALSGLLECVQRDGFFTHWLKGTPPRRIDVATLERDSTKRLVEAARAVGLDPMLFDVTNEMDVPTCLAVLVGNEPHPQVTMGASTRVDGDTAIHDALLEAASVHHVIERPKEPVTLDDRYEPFSDPTWSTHKRLAFWAGAASLPRIAPFLGGGPTTLAEFRRGSVDAGGAKKNLEAVVDKVRRRGFEAWCVEARHAALDELGYASVRVVVPGLVPFYHEERNAPLGLRRLAFDGKENVGPSDGWTPSPHPFP